MEIFGVNLIITKMDDESVGQMLDLLAGEMIEIVEGPHTGLLMMAARDSFDTDFYLGEVLVTEAAVECMGKSGYAMVIGDEPDKAMLSACVEAVLKGDNDELKRRIIGILAEEKEKIESIDRKEMTLIAKTQVTFETMPKG